MGESSSSISSPSTLSDGHDELRRLRARPLCNQEEKTNVITLNDQEEKRHVTTQRLIHHHNVSQQHLPLNLYPIHPTLNSGYEHLLKVVFVP